MQILVIGLNPAVDVEWRVGEVRWDEKNVVTSERRWAGGKSVNVARWLRHLGGSVRLLAALGGTTGREIQRQLRAEGVSLSAVKLAEPTRANVVVTQRAGPQLRFNPRGPRLSAGEWDRFFIVAERELRRSSLVVLSGALSRAARPTIYRDLVRLAHRRGVRVLLDCDGAALSAAVPARPFLIKPNEFELAHWCGRELTDEPAVRRAAGELSRASRGWVFVSRAQHGGLLVNAAEKVALRAIPPAVRARNTVGAGDALLAAVALQIAAAAPPADWLRWGVATATAGVQVAAGEMANPQRIEMASRQLRLAVVG